MKKLVSTLLICALLMALMGAAVAEPYTFPSSGISVELPLVSEPTTFKIWTWNDTNVDFQNSIAWKKLSEMTGITFEFTVYPDHNTLALEYAAGNYPDILLRFGNGNVKEEMIEAGDMIKISDYWELAPNAKAFLERTGFMSAIVREDGSAWSLPSIDLSDDGTAAWDLFYINRTWCEELGLPLPQTTEQVFDTLIAFRDNAGKGSIPEYIVPYYLNYATDRDYQAQCTVTRLMNAFGVPFGGFYDWYYWDEEAREMKGNATMDGFKACVRYLAKMYAEKLLPPTFFTDLDYASTNAVYSQLGVNPYVGLIAWYGLPKEGLYGYDGNYWPIVITGSDEGFTANYSQGMKNVVWDQNFMITAKCPNPEAAVRLYDLMSIPEIAASLTMGAEGYAWKINGDNQIEMIDRSGMEYVHETALINNGCQCAMLDRGASVITPASMLFEGSRAWAIKELYKPYIAKVDYQVPSIPNYVWSENDRDTRNDIRNEVSSYIGQTVANWIAGNGDVDAEWDQYIATLEEYGYQELLDLWTNAVNRFYAITGK